MFTVHCAVCSMQYAVCNMQCAVCIVHCTVCEKGWPSLGKGGRHGQELSGRGNVANGMEVDRESSHHSEGWPVCQSLPLEQTCGCSPAPSAARPLWPAAAQLALDSPQPPPLPCVAPWLRWRQRPSHPVCRRAALVRSGACGRSKAFTWEGRGSIGRA